MDLSNILTVAIQGKPARTVWLFQIERYVATLIIKATRRYDPIMRLLRTNLFEMGGYAPLVGLFSEEYSCYLLQEVGC